MHTYCKKDFIRMQMRFASQQFKLLEICQPLPPGCWGKGAWHTPHTGFFCLSSSRKARVDQSRIASLLRECQGLNSCPFCLLRCAFPTEPPWWLLWLPSLCALWMAAAAPLSSRCYMEGWRAQASRMTHSKLTRKSSAHVCVAFTLRIVSPSLMTQLCSQPVTNASSTVCSAHLYSLTALPGPGLTA